MIILKRLNGKSFMINDDLIEFVEETPDTVITLTNGRKYVVSDTIDEIIDMIVKYKKQVYTLVLESSEN